MGLGAVGSAAFNLFVFVFVFVFVIVIVIVFVFVSRCCFWIALDMSFQKCMGFRAWDCRKCSFQSLCLCLCLCLRICNCHCLCICVTLPSLNSSWPELSENVWVWGRGTVRSADFNLWAKCRGWVGGGGGGGLDKCTSWSDLHRVRQKFMINSEHSFKRSCDGV